MLGLVVSTIVPFWLHSLKLLQSSVAREVRVASKVFPQWPFRFVVVLTVVRLTFPQVSLAVGGSKSHGTVHSMVLSATHEIAGFVVSTMVTFWLHSMKLLHSSVARQVR